MEVADFDAYKVAAAIMDKIKDEYKNLKTLNIMVMGKTGVGKSTLINSVFNEPIAKTGIGRPVTTGIKQYK